MSRRGPGPGEGREPLVIDFPSLAELLAELDKDAPRYGLTTQRIIVAPEYVDRVLAAGGRQTAALASKFLRRVPPVACSLITAPPCP